MNLADSPREGSKIPNKVILPGDTEEDLIYSGMRHVFGKTGETVAASKRDVNGKAERRVQVNQRLKTDRRESASSSISFQSDVSVEQPPNISDGKLSTSNSQTERRDSSFSYVSLRSDSSVQMPPNLSEETASETTRLKTDRRESASSSISFQSDGSVEQPPNISDGKLSTSNSQTERRDSSFSYVSLRSDSSVQMPPNLSEETASETTRMEKQRIRRWRGLSIPPPHIAQRQHTGRQQTFPRTVLAQRNATIEDSLNVCDGASHCHISLEADRRESSASSCLSLHSDISIGLPPCMKDGTVYPITRVQEEESPNKGEGVAPYVIRCLGYRPQSPSPSHTSTESDSSLEKFPNSDQATSQHQPRRLSSGSLWSLGSLASHIPSEETVVPSQNTSANIQRAIEGHKASLKKRFEVMPGGSTKLSCDVPFHAIYTELYITAGDSQGINIEHEVQQTEMMHRRQAMPPDEAINCSDIFRPLRGEQRPIRRVMTKGIAGIGKTMSVQKFILDWAEGRANQDVDFIFLLPFRELNLMCGVQHSLHSLLVELFEEFQALEDLEVYKACKLLFIFDGLDESKLRLDFQEMEVCDVNKAATVSALVTNLIKGHLLPTALIWVTSRPAAASQIPALYIDQVMELRGFSDAQKVKFLRSRVANQRLADKIIAHVRATRTLFIMCHIPVFCSFIATVFQQILNKKPIRDIPHTLTQIFTEFVITQINTRQSQESSREAILKLAKLAFTYLQSQQFNFYEEDLRECGIDTRDASVFSGLCIEIIKEESVGRGKRTYCFLHLTIQEFLAALHVIHSFVTKNAKVLESFHLLVSDKKMDLYDLLKAAVDKSLQSEHGHLDLFLRFLLGLSLEPNQKLLQSLLKGTRSRASDITKKITEYMDQILKAQIRKRTITYIKELRGENLSPERCINLFHCLIEMRDFSMQDEIQEYLKSKRCVEFNLSPAQCSALAYMLQMSEEPLDELDLRQYNTTDEGRKRLVPAVRWCRRARLDCCKLTVKAYQTVVLSLQSLGSQLSELDLSYNSLQNSGLKLLAQGLLSPHCKLQTLSLVGCHFTELSSSTIASVLQSEHSALRELDLSDNELQDSGVEHLAAGLKSLNCKVHILRLSTCLVSTRGCAALAAALTFNPFHLKELDLSYNYPRTSGVEQLSARLQDSDCALETLNVKHAGRYRLLSAPQRYFYKLHLDPNTAHRNLTLSERNQKVTRGPAQPYPDHPERFDCWPQVLCREPLTGRCYWEVEWTGTAAIGFTCKGIRRKGGGDDVVLGHNPKSVTLYCNEKGYSVYHGKRKTEIEFPPYECNRVGVFLDWPNGLVSFYRVSSEGSLLLHTIYSSFNKPLYAGFTLYPSDTIISLCRMKV
ncbi:NACHT, LRR and PYD domains-containing protein 3-like isoform X4 [Clupea harengus]|uniref:NACHT, LRR and PYD domains-containing protein 3-like isoform X4 n=1 Tax=Clupea harengus TaxID=7950 RepID=A0A6P8GHF6_CLUHA|nr:NACHT, LRR and PYD domains-containing protein 3-like isoform X4 [Clupea harengus]